MLVDMISDNDAERHKLLTQVRLDENEKNEKNLLSVYNLFYDSIKFILLNIFKRWKIKNC